MEQKILQSLGSLALVHYRLGFELQTAPNLAVNTRSTSGVNSGLSLINPPQPLPRCISLHTYQPHSIQRDSPVLVFPFQILPKPSGVSQLSTMSKGHFLSKFAKKKSR